MSDFNFVISEAYFRFDKMFKITFLTCNILRMLKANLNIKKKLLVLKCVKVTKQFE